jgi:hypothetical protein
MTQPGLLGLALGFERTYHGHQLAAAVRIIAGPFNKANYRARLEYRPREEENLRYPKYCIWRLITSESLSRYPVKPLCNVRRKHRLQRLRADASPRLFRVLKRLKAFALLFAVRPATYPNFLDTHHQVGSEATLVHTTIPACCNDERQQLNRIMLAHH